MHKESWKKPLLLLFNIDNNNIHKIIFNNKIKDFLTPQISISKSGVHVLVLSLTKQNNKNP